MLGVLSMLIFLILLILGFWTPNHEVKKAMQNKEVKISGKSLSLSNPLTFTVKK